MNKPLRTLGYAALLGFLVQSPGFSQVDNSRYQFRVTVDLISLNVTVTDTRNRFITDLLQEEFSVYEDGISQEVSVFSREDLPIRMVLLIDASASMDEKMTFAQEAAVNFVGEMKDDDLTEVRRLRKQSTRPAAFHRRRGEVEPSDSHDTSWGHDEPL